MGRGSPSPFTTPLDAFGVERACSFFSVGTRHMTNSMSLQLGFVVNMIIQVRYNTYLQHVLDGPRFQQFDAAIERQRRSLDVFSALDGSAAAGDERRIHSDMLFAARKWPEYDAAQNGLRKRRTCLFYPLKRYVGGYNARRNVQQTVWNGRLFAGASRNWRFSRTSPGTTAKSLTRVHLIRHCLYRHSFNGLRALQQCGPAVRPRHTSARHCAVWIFNRLRLFKLLSPHADTPMP